MRVRYRTAKRDEVDVGPLYGSLRKPLRYILTC